MSCSCCEFFHKSSSVEVVGTELVVTFDTPVTGVIDKQRFCFAITTTIPTVTDTDTVALVIDGVNVPLWNKYGNIVLAKDIVARKCYKGYYGVQGVDPHVIAINTPIPQIQCVCTTVNA